MSDDVILTTERLLLRAPRPDDAQAIHTLVSAREVAAGTLTIPHPYPDGAADEWVRGRLDESARGDGVTFVVTLRDGGEVIGAIGLHIQRSDHRAEIGYWIGVPYWGRGYATEAAQAIVDHGFEAHALNKITAAHFDRNPASGRVLVKVGMTREGTLRQHHHKWGEYLDAEIYAILREEWAKR